VTVKAMLCWSEYYEGKWEQSRTSDLATAVTIGVFPASGSRSFHRPELSLGVSGETIRRGSAEGDDDTDPQLRISMAYSSWYRQVSWVSSPRAFLVVGARAAPVETIGEHLTAGPLPAPTLFRAAFDGSDFLVVYLEASRGGTRHVLRSTTGSQLVGPRNTLQDVWRAPLLFSDGRHAFYVTSAEASLPDLNFGIYPPVQPYLELPPVVIAEPPLPDNLPPSDVLDGLEGLYPVPASPAASTDIRFKLRASGAVDYQGQVVNPSGSISNPRGRG
jgi:hypothetical protein